MIKDQYYVSTLNKGSPDFFLRIRKGYPDPPMAGIVFFKSGLPAVKSGSSKKYYAWTRTPGPADNNFQRN